MNWLQLSDLHIKECADWEIMKKSYERILSKEKISFVVVTGDLHNFDEDYKETKKFLDLIISFTSIDKKDLFLIPGNHDSKDFKLKEALVNDILKNMDNDSEYYKKYEEELQESFGEYINFYKEYFEEECYDFKNVKIHNWNNKINIIGLNSALISDGKNNHHQIIDTLLLAKINIDNNLPTIAIGHHEISYLFEEHQNVLKRVFTDLNVAAYLCGDLHKDSTKNISNHSSSNKTIPCIVCGKSSIDQTDEYSDNSFIIYKSESGSRTNKVTVHHYSWDSEKKSFYESSKFDNDDGTFEFVLYPSQKSELKEDKTIVNNIMKKESVYDDILKLEGYVLIGGRGKDGIKYIWKKNKQIVESLAFNKIISNYKTIQVENKTSAYTSSLSHGCILKADNSECVFCETGKNPFGGYLTSKDIALQNIFMALYDSDCPSYPEVRDNSREFAYMGQGEPGHAYHLIRESILLTDYAMNSINQKIPRYIISTCGIHGFVPLLISDINNKVYSNNISLHFSLNVIGNDRNKLMPVNKNNNFKDFIKECELFFECTRQKVSVSLIIFNNLNINIEDVTFSYTLTKEKLGEILDILDPKMFRINLRDFNSNGIFRLEDVSNEYATNLLNEVTNKGFEGKLFSCFGKSEKSAFGMLISSKDCMTKPGKTTLKNYYEAIKLLNEAEKHI